MSKELNLSESDTSKDPKDFYSFIGLKVKNHCEKELKENKKLSQETLNSYEKLSKLDILLRRSLIKKAIMTILYNASSLTIINYIKEEFTKEYNTKNENDKNYKELYLYKLKKNPSIIFKESDFNILGKTLDKVIFSDYPRLKQFKEYLRKIAKISNKLKIPIPWNLPTGLVVKQQFHHKKTIKIKPFIYSKTLLNLTVAIKGKYDTSKQPNALMPNLIHYLDGASLGLVINEYFKIIDNKNFLSIHDCFAVPCNKSKLLTSFLKSAYCILYTNNNYLTNFDENFYNSIIKHYGKDKVSLITNNNSIKLSVITESDKIIVDYPNIKTIIKANTKWNRCNKSYIFNILEYYFLLRGWRETMKISQLLL